jgi:recombination associated protein RdgC
MPLLKGSATFSRFRVVAAKRSAKTDLDLAKALRTHAFAPLEPSAPEERAQGFVELDDHDAAAFSPGALYRGEIALFAYRVDEVRIPSAVVRGELAGWQRKFEEENGRKPGKKEKADAKDEVRHTLRSRYPLASKAFDICWNQDAGLLQIWAGSRKAVDEVQAALEKACAVQLVPVVPIATAARLELAVDALKPTPELSMPGSEGTHGQP